MKLLVSAMSACLNIGGAMESRSAITLISGKCKITQKYFLGGAEEECIIE
jgi:hypothetical protein